MQVRTCAGWIGIAAGAATTANAAERLTIALSHSSLALPLYVAQAKGYFQEAGVAVHSIECLGGQRCMAELLEGRADIATVTELAVAFQSFKRSDFAIFVTFASSQRHEKLVVRKSSGIRDWSQLAGKRVATVRATSSHYFLDSAALLHGVDPRRLDLLALAPEQVGPALVEGRVDAAAIWEPFAQETLRALGTDGLVMPGTRIYASTFNLVARRDLIARREGDLVRTIRALQHAIQFIAEQPDEAQAILKSRLGVDQAYVDATWRDYRYQLSLNQSLLSTLEGQVRWAIREGHVPPASQMPSLLQFIDLGPMKKAMPDVPTLVK